MSNNVNGNQSRSPIDEAHDELQYLKCIEKIIKKGIKREDRTGLLAEIME